MSQVQGQDRYLLQEPEADLEREVDIKVSRVPRPILPLHCVSECDLPLLPIGQT